jgi:RNA polymerase sporulation-specific sigma factor
MRVERRELVQLHVSRLKMAAKDQKRSRCAREADLELLRCYQNGDEEALIALFKGHYGLIYSWVNQVLVVIPWANRDDIEQEALIGFWVAAKTFDTSGNGDFHSEARNCAWRKIFESKEVRIVGRTLYEHYRRVTDAQNNLMKLLNRMPTIVELAQEAGLSVNQVDTALNVIAAFTFPLEEADGRQASEDTYQSQLISDAMNQLDADELDIITRYYFYGQTDSEIAKDLGMSPGAVKMARHRALKKLRGNLE